MLADLQKPRDGLHFFFAIAIAFGYSGDSMVRTNQDS